MAVTRVRHYRHVVFETDLSEREVFQEARYSEAFRERLRFDLRAEAKFSHTLRRWGFCRADIWSPEEAGAAADLLRVLAVRGKMQRAAVSRSGRPADIDAFIWDEAELDFDGLLADAVHEEARGDAQRRRRQRSPPAKARRRRSCRCQESCTPHCAAQHAAR